MLRDLVNLIRGIYDREGHIPLHSTHTTSGTLANMNKCRSSGYLSLGRFVGYFEERLCEITGARYCIATNSGTSALHLSLLLSGVKPDKSKHVACQSFTYISTANAIIHAGSTPVFVDVDRNTMGMCPDSLAQCFDQFGAENFAAVMPMNTLGVNCDIKEIKHLCKEHGIPVILDACQSLMTPGFYDGTLSCLSFNGNKPVTTGGGGCILTDDPDIEMNARKYLNQIGPMDRVWYNYRMPNINAAIGVGTLQEYEHIRDRKVEIAKKYKDFAAKHSIECPTPNCPWLNAFYVDDPVYVKEYLSNNLIDSRLGFPLIHEMEIYRDCMQTDISQAPLIQERMIMLPSGIK